MLDVIHAGMSKVDKLQDMRLRSDSLRRTVLQIAGLSSAAMT